MKKGDSLADKRYLLFVCDQYYPAGGLADKRGSFDTVNDALAEIESKYATYDFKEIYDRVEGREINV